MRMKSIILLLCISFTASAAFAMDLTAWKSQAQATSGNVKADTTGWTLDGTAGISFDYGNLDEDANPQTTGAGATIEYIFNLANSGECTDLGSVAGFNNTESSELRLGQWNNTGTFGVTVFGEGDYTFPSASSVFGTDVHAAFVNRTDGAFELFVNGVSQGTDTNGGFVTNGGAGTLGMASNNSNPSTGTVYGVASYNRALSAAEIAALTATITLPLPPIEAEVGPYVQFAGSDSAVVRWDTGSNSNSVVEYGTSPASLTSRVESAVLTKVHEVAISGLDIKDKYFYRVGTSTGGEVFSNVFWFDNNINYSRADVSGIASPYPVDSLTSLYTAAADHIIAETGITKGICLVYGCGEGRLAFELAKRTDMMIIGVDTDGVKIDTAASKLIEAGVYGARVTVRKVTSLDSLPFTKYMANLIVSDDMIATGQCNGSATEMFRVLRPSGGVAFLGQPNGCPSVLNQATLEGWLGGLIYTTTNDGNGVWSKVDRPELTGAGWWSHAHGGPDAAGNSHDTLEGGKGTGDFDLQWVSWPGADAKVDRQIRGHSPVTKNGRMAYRGFNRIITLDTYNGSILWSLEIPGLKRFNLPRDSGWICMDDDSIYVAVDDDCWQLSANDGNRTATHKLNDAGFDWGCVIRYNDKLYGSAVIADSFYTGWWGGGYWYESADSKICSKYLFANNLDGSRAWTYNSAESDKGVIINSTICMGGGRVYFVESRNPSAESLTTGQIGSQLWTDLYLVALNSDTGVRVWQKNLKTAPGGDPVVANGTAIIHLMYSDETLVLETSDTQYYIYAYAASDGTAKWNTSQAWTANRDHGSHLQRVVIANGRVWGIGNIKGLSLTNGTVGGAATMPLTICGAVAASGNVFLGRFNKGDMKMWDSQTGSLTSWSRIRPGCYINVLGSGGMVLAPEGGGGCDCYDGGFHTSTAFIRSEN